MLSAALPINAKVLSLFSVIVEVFRERRSARRYASCPLRSVRYYTQAARCGDVAGVWLESSPARQGRRRAKNEECSEEGG